MDAGVRIMVEDGVLRVEAGRIMVEDGVLSAVAGRFAVGRGSFGVALGLVPGRRARRKGGGG